MLGLEPDSVTIQRRELRRSVILEGIVRELGLGTAAVQRCYRRGWML